LAPVWLLWSQVNQLTPEQKEAAERLAYIKANYTKHEFLIPMRDGVRLFTSVYTPKEPSQPYPFMLTRTPTRWPLRGLLLNQQILPIVAATRAQFDGLKRAPAAALRRRSFRRRPETRLKGKERSSLHLG
jgi:hypothetical protein